jgi:hypothetical protein
MKMTIDDHSCDAVLFCNFQYDLLRFDGVKNFVHLPRSRSPVWRVPQQAGYRVTLDT